MKKRLLVVTLAALTGNVFAGSWQEKLTPLTVGGFSEVRPFEAEYRFGWSGFEAARAKVKLDQTADQTRIAVTGGTTGAARALWRLDARQDAQIWRKGLRSHYFQQQEIYAKRQVYIEAAFQPDGLWRFRQVLPDPAGIARWKKIKEEPMRDILAALLFVRSQRLASGDEVVVSAFPGDAPFLAETKVKGRETLTVAGQPRATIKMEFTLKRIVTKGEKKGQLEPHGKFRRGTVWVSDDADRLPLRAEVEIFVGYVFGELDKVTFR